MNAILCTAKSPLMEHGWNRNTGLHWFDAITPARVEPVSQKFQTNYCPVLMNPIGTEKLRCRTMCRINES